MSSKQMVDYLTRKHIRSSYPLGTEAGQTVPHSHFHIIPRLSDEARKASDISDAERKNIALGEGPRTKLSDDEGTELSRLIQVGIEKEIKLLQAAGDFVEESGFYMRTGERGIKL
jgi:diadenosine tetraphosphate (Ap4A) HIT family hydrolase